MSCRSNPGNSGMTSLAHARSGLSDAQTLSVFHQALNMGRANPNPSREQVERFITSQRNQAADHIRAGRLNPEQGERVVARLNRVLEGELPNGPTFHAWRSIENYSNQANRTAENITTELARDLGLTPAQAKIRRQELIREYDRLDPKPRQDFQAIQAKLSEYSRLNTGDNNLVLFPRNAATVYAYRKMIEEAERNLVARPNQRRGNRFADDPGRGLPLYHSNVRARTSRWYSSPIFQSAPRSFYPANVAWAGRSDILQPG